MLLGDVVDEFLDEYRLAHARAAEQSNFAAFQERLDQVNNLHAGFKHLGSRRLFMERRSRPVNRHPLLVFDRTQLVDGLTDDVHDASQRAVSHRHGDRPTEVNRLHPAHHAVGGFHSNAACAPFAQVLLHLEDDIDRLRHLEAIADHAQRLVNGGQARLGELHVHRRSSDLHYVSNVFRHRKSALSL